MDKQISGNNPLRGAEVQKIPRGQELQALQDAGTDDKQNVFFKDRQGDTFEAAGKNLDLKGIAPGATIQFGEQQVTVTAVEAGQPPTAVATLCEFAAEQHPLDPERAEQALLAAIDEIKNDDDALRVASMGLKLSLFNVVGPALSRGLTTAADTNLLRHFALEAYGHGYTVQADFAMKGAVQLQKVGR